MTVPAADHLADDEFPDDEFPVEVLPTCPQDDYTGDGYCANEIALNAWLMEENGPCEGLPAQDTPAAAIPTRFRGPARNFPYSPQARPHRNRRGSATRRRVRDP
ncbi:hypothetical protein [Streptomyces nigrescens]|uniref:hypothetical protein n=1 Tax=Streptomyces nigrescens TaxID=1920 RepID=UPI0036FD7A7E